MAKGKIIAVSGIENPYGRPVSTYVAWAAIIGLVGALFWYTVKPEE